MIQQKNWKDCWKNNAVYWHGKLRYYYVFACQNANRFHSVNILKNFFIRNSNVNDPIKEIAWLGSKKNVYPKNEIDWIGINQAEVKWQSQ